MGPLEKEMKEIDGPTDDELKELYTHDGMSD
jgi:hypothetical protein